MSTAAERQRRPESSAERRNLGDFEALNLGAEPPLVVFRARHPRVDRRQVSLRWFGAVVLCGLVGAALIGVLIDAAFDGRSRFGRPPEFANPSRRAKADAGSPIRGDRLLRAADIVAEKQSFRVPTTIRVGDRQIVRPRGFVHVATTLTLVPTADADAVPSFNPLKLTAAEPSLPDPPTDPDRALADADVSFTTIDLADADVTRFGGALLAGDVEAQVDAFSGTAADGVSPAAARLPPTRSTRPNLLPTGTLAFGADPQAIPLSSIEVRMVPENVTVAARSEASRDGPDAAEKLVVLHQGDTLEQALRNAGASPRRATAIVAAFGAKRGAAPVGDGRRLKLLFAKTEGGRPPQIARISVYADERLETTVAMKDNGGYVRIDNPAPAAAATATENDEDVAGLRLYDSFYETALKQTIPKPLIDAMVRVFANDVDFQRSVAAGDSFDAFYTDDTDGPAELLFASLTVRNETFRFYRFDQPDGAGAEFYDENGRSILKFLMRNPVPNARFTSAFGMRVHPILGYARPHTGVDWAAPIGTPILATGTGTVLRAHRESAYGNRIEIEHANGYVTTYSHMAGFARGMADGVHVEQGQVVGYLGQTGLATGPHLHYEVMVNGRFVDPMRVKLARTRDLDGAQLADFRRERDRIDGLMAGPSNAGLALEHQAAN